MSELLGIARPKIHGGKLDELEKRFSVLRCNQKVSYRRASYLALLSELERCFLIIATGASIFLPLLGEAQSTTSPLQGLTVTSQGPFSAYGAPEAFSRSRFGTLTQAYVLPPFTVYTGLEYELTSPRQGFPDHLFTQELEIGLPYRFGVAKGRRIGSARIDT